MIGVFLNIPYKHPSGAMCNNVVLVLNIAVFSFMYKNCVLYLSRESHLGHAELARFILPYGRNVINEESQIGQYTLSLLR